jgi:hypothetical protein
VFKLLQQPEYVHVLINHLPLTGLFAALLCLIGALITRKRVAIYLGMALVSLFALSAWPVSEYGEDSYDRVYSMADDAGGNYLKQHKELAERWTWVFYVTAAAGVAGMAASWKWPKCLWVTASAVALLTAGSLVAGAAIADYGGKVRHPEFRRSGDLKGARTMVAPCCTRLVCAGTRPDFNGRPRALGELAVTPDLG